MFKARPPSGNSLEAAPTKRTALTAARLLALLGALILAAALSGVLPVQGQTATVLVSNTGQTATSFNATLNNAGQKRAQGFTTGTNDEGYTLSSIGFRFKNVAETAAASKLTATLAAESSGDPGSDLCTLTNPTIAANAVNTFTAPTSCPILAANTTYFFVLERSDASGNSIGVNLTSSGNQDSTPATGWSISDDRHQGSSTGPWNHTSGESYLIEVRGEAVAVNVPATGLPTISGTAQEGNALGVDVSGISDGNGIPEGVVYSYRWLADGVAIVGAEAATYWLAASDIGKRISVEVTFTDSAGFVETLTSARTAAVTDDPTLTVNWSATMTVDTHLDYQGYGAPTSSVPNALGSVSPGSFTSGGDPYTVHGVYYDANYEFLTLELDAELGGVFDLELGQTTTLNSGSSQFNMLANGNAVNDWAAAGPNWTDGQKVALAIREHVDFPPTGQVTIDGAFAENEVLTANTSAIEDANGLTGVSYSYQWGRSNCTDSANDGDIIGATGSTRTLTATDVTCALSVKVTFEDDVGFEHELIAAATTIDLSLAEWALSLSSGQIIEGDAGGVTVTLRITNGYTFNSPVTANLFYNTLRVQAGRNLFGKDSVHTVTVAAGASQGSVTLLAKDDEFFLGNKTYAITARVGQTQLGDAVDLTVVEDEPRPRITLSVDDATIVEGESFTITASINPRFVSPATIPVNFSDPSDVIPGSDTDTIRLAAGEDGRTLTVTTTNDTEDRPDATVIVSLGTLTSPLLAGSPSSVTITVVDNDGPPSAPANLQAAHGGSGVVLLTWEAAPSESSPVTEYQMRLRRTDSSNWNPDWATVAGGAGVRGANAGPLTNGVPYIFQVRAINATGNGAVAETTFTPFGPPGAPTVTVSPRDRALFVTWTVPDDGGRPTDQYQVQWKTGGREFSASYQHTVDSREDTIISLGNGSQYLVRVRASNDGGGVYGDWSSAMPGSPRELPVPTNFTALWLSRSGNPPVDYNKTQNTLTVRWFVVRGATEYQVDYRQRGETGDWTRVNGYFDHLPSTTRGHRPVAVATGLDCNTEYRFRVRARNQSDPLLESLDGWTPYDFTSARTGPCALPDRITNVLATLEPRCADLSWTPPSGDQQPSGYKIQRYFFDTPNGAWETIEDNTRRAAATFSDCSQEYRDHEGGIGYFITALGAEGFGATEILYKKPSGQPNPPRNVRLTRDTQFVRRLEWDQAPDAWRTTVLAGREGGMRNSVVADLWPTWYQVERREFAYDQFDERYFPDDSDWEVMRSAGDENTSRSYTDNEDRGSRLYVYRVIPHNSAGAALDFFGDWSFDGPTYTRTLDNVQGDDQQQDPAPTVASASINSSPGADGTYAIGDMVEATVTFSEAVNVTGSPRLTLSIGGQSRTASYARGSGATALVFAHTVQEGDQGGVSIGASAVSLNGGSINAVDDAQAATLTHAAVTASGHTVDGVRPALGSAAVNGAILTLAYGEALDGNSIPSPGAFTVSVAGAARSVSSVSVSGSQVSLTLAPAVENGDSVTVSYTAPTANLLRDQAGNAAASFSGRTVTNDTEAATDDTAGGGDATPLTAASENTPEAHDGETPFTFELRFSEEFELSYKTLRDHAFTVVGGSVEKAKRLEKGSNIGWRITVQPDANADVTITLPATEDCGDSGAICTADGRKLSNRLELTVSGPGE